MATMPTTPADVPEMSYGDIADAHHQHLLALVLAHHGTGDPAPAEVLARHAVAALATQHALAERVLYTRWVTARDALTYGASVDDTAAGMGLDVDEVLLGLTCWADGQLREHLMTQAQHDEVLALVDNAEVTR